MKPQPRYYFMLELGDGGVGPYTIAEFLELHRKLVTFPDASPQFRDAAMRLEEAIGKSAAPPKRAARFGRRE
jgi:hypothetical protein